MDLIGPLKETPRDNKYIITVTDYFSKSAEAESLKDKSATAVADILCSVSNYYNSYDLLSLEL